MQRVLEAQTAASCPDSPVERLVWPGVQDRVVLSTAESK